MQRNENQTPLSHSLINHYKVSDRIIERDFTSWINKYLQKVVWVWGFSVHEFFSLNIDREFEE